MVSRQDVTVPRTKELLCDGGEHTLYLSQGKCSSEKAVACIVASVLVAEHGFSVIHAHGQRWIHALEDATQFRYIGTSTQVAGFREVAIGEDMAGTQVDEVGAGCEFMRHGDDIVVGSCREAAGTEGESVVRIVH